MKVSAEQKRGISIGLILLIFGSIPAVAQARGNTTFIHGDLSKDVVTPDGTHFLYNSNGSPRGIIRTCSATGMSPVTCHYWGPNYYRSP